MKRIFFLVSLVLFLLSLGSSILRTGQVYAVDDEGEGGGNGGGGVELQNLETVGIPIGNKLVLKNGSAVQDVFNSTDDMVNLIVKVLFVGAGFVLFFMIVGAGFAMIKGSGDDKNKAKTTMTSALVGFVIMFSAYWIVQIIQLITGINMNF